MSLDRHLVATTEDLQDEGSHIIVDVEGMEIGIFNIENQYYAIANYCVHQGGPLCDKGELSGQVVLGEDDWEWEYKDEGKLVSCPWHRWRFNVTTGKNANDERYAVPTYDVEVEEKDIYVLK